MIRSSNGTNRRSSPKPRCRLYNDGISREERVRGGLIAFGLVLAFLATLVGPARAAEPYDIHVILPLTGNGAFLGQGHRDSLDTLAEIVNKSDGIDGRPLQFVYHDDQSSPQVAVQLATALLA